MWCGWAIMFLRVLKDVIIIDTDLWVWTSFVRKFDIILEYKGFLVFSTWLFACIRNVGSPFIYNLYWKFLESDQRGKNIIIQWLRVISEFVGIIVNLQWHANIKWYVKIMNS